MSRSTCGCAVRKRADHRRQHQIDRRRRCVDAQAARSDLAQAPHLVQRIAHVTQRWRHARQQQFPASVSATLRVVAEQMAHLDSEKPATR